MTRNPPFGEAKLPAFISAAIDSIVGLSALGIDSAITARIPQFLVPAAPTLNVISCFQCAPTAWFVGGQLGPRLQGMMGGRNGWIAGGILGGLLPVAGIAAIGWYLTSQPS